MLRINRTIVFALCFGLAGGVAFAELSSKAKKAEKLISAGKAGEAVEIYKELMAKDPQKNPDLYKEGKEGMAKCLLIGIKNDFTAKKFAETKAAANTVITEFKDTPSFKEAAKYMVLAQLELCKPLLEAGKFDEVITQNWDVKNKLPQDAEGLDKLNGITGTAFYGQGRKALDSKELKTALSKFESVIKEYPQSDKIEAAKTDFAEVSFSAAALMSDQNDALAVYNMIMAVLPDKPEAVTKAKQNAAKILLDRADENIKAQKFEEAMKNLDAAVKVSVDKESSARCSYALGVCFRMTGQDEKAQSSYKEAAKEQDDKYSAMAYADMYLIQMKLDNKQEALNDIKQAVFLAPDNSDYLFKQADLLYKMGRAEEAQKAAAKLAAVLPAETAKAYVNKEVLQYKLGQSYLILGRYTEAAVELEKALARKPDMTEAKRSLALAQFSDKNYTGAISSFDSLIKEASIDYDSLSEKAAKDSSAETAIKTENLRKEIAFFHYQKGLSYEQLGDYEKAEQECRLGLEGVSTQEAAETLKRIQSAAQQKSQPAQLK